jgi:hypothetical protein
MAVHGNTRAWPKRFWTNYDSDRPPIGGIFRRGCALRAIPVLPAPLHMKNLFPRLHVSMFHAFLSYLERMLHISTFKTYSTTSTRTLCKRWTRGPSLFYVNVPLPCSLFTSDRTGLEWSVKFNEVVDLQGMVLGVVWIAFSASIHVSAVSSRLPC